MPAGVTDAPGRIVQGYKLPARRHIRLDAKSIVIL